MIKTFRHKGLKAFFETGSRKGIQPAHAVRLQLQLTALNSAASEADMNVPAWRLHLISGRNPKGQEVQAHWSVSVSGHWRLTFCIDSGHAYFVDYIDYH